MTQQKAKELTLEVWEYLRDHPEIYAKKLLPVELFAKIKLLKSWCPLCELFRVDGACKRRCPLDCLVYGSDWNLWDISSLSDNATRQQAAANIVEKVKAWKPRG